MSPVSFFKCLADETRLRLMLLIQSEGELCVCELTHALQEIQPKISRHLAQLRKSGLLLDSKRGQWVYYRLNPTLPYWIKATLEHTASGNEAFMQEVRRRLADMCARPGVSSACCD
ncbi:metalloregulator ArsR/SmtB family transcription factor [Hahella sp. CR1]|uniref:metalloregulator ArsR/SmtB family transcription factor n=1 Tax=Hahella sp. CR1 TaxID=2992807 RepID=UPI002441D2E8|nr:metalloregulator ArsR/SmtB family transcription factor [Hahella sp. CR1]MDG9667570.1 metalloregulator ArsR/SmtB family transcription factor [Hahella sp. CR1]